MCVVSMIVDHYGDKWRQPGWQQPPTPGFDALQVHLTQITRLEFDQLKKEVLDMKELIKKALDYDKKNDEPDCQKDEKVQIVKDVAKLVGVSLDDLFPEGKRG